MGQTLFAEVYPLMVQRFFFAIVGRPMRPWVLSVCRAIQSKHGYLNWHTKGETAWVPTGQDALRGGAVAGGRWQGALLVARGLIESGCGGTTRALVHLAGPGRDDSQSQVAMR
jgi:hypothetical protein